jgi:hypothetical protein
MRQFQSVANLYGLNRSTSSNWWRGKTIPREQYRREMHRNLTDKQEKKLVKHINRLCDQGNIPSYPMVKIFVESNIERGGFRFTKNVEGLSIMMTRCLIAEPSFASLRMVVRCCRLSHLKPMTLRSKNRFVKMRTLLSRRTVLDCRRVTKSCLAR